MYKVLKFQPFWTISSGDITSFMRGTYKKSPCISLFLLFLLKIFLQRTSKSAFSVKPLVLKRKTLCLTKLEQLKYISWKKSYKIIINTIKMIAIIIRNSWLKLSCSKNFTTIIWWAKNLDCLEYASQALQNAINACWHSVWQLSLSRAFQTLLNWSW